MKHLNLLIIFFILSIGFVGHISGQKRSPIRPNAARINRRLPTVLISLEKVEDPKKPLPEDGERMVWFRLRNNSIWSIGLDASGGQMLHDKDVRLYYDLLNPEGNIIRRHACHVCSIIGLGSGKSILFGLPYDEVVGADSFRIEFRYEWEDKLLVAPAEEPTHYVYFYTADISKK